VTDPYSSREIIKLIFNLLYNINGTWYQVQFHTAKSGWTILEHEFSLSTVLKPEVCGLFSVLKRDGSGIRYRSIDRLNNIVYWYLANSEKSGSVHFCRQKMVTFELFRIIHLAISPEEMMTRLEKRANFDDKKEAIQKRLAIYRTDTVPVLEKYRHKVVHVSGRNL